jgi:hypothetical protein
MFEKIDDFLVNIGWYRFINFIENWVYPGYYLRNCLFNRYDLIKIPQIKVYEYVDKTYLMLCANMQIIVDFIEKENPEKYICWYCDPDTGEELGHKYGECEIYSIMFPEYKDKWVMDIIKEIYQFWTVEYPEYVKDEQYLLDFWSKYFSVFSLDLNEKPIATSMADFDDDVNWDLLTKYLDKNKLFETNYVLKIHRDLEIKMEQLCQKYLHLAIEVRPYLWT